MFHDEDIAYRLDKSVIGELMKADKTHRCIWCLIPMIARYGANKLLEDTEIFQVLAKYYLMGKTANSLQSSSARRRMIEFAPADFKIFAGLSEVLQPEAWNVFCNKLSEQLLRQGSIWHGERFRCRESPSVVCVDTEELHASYRFNSSISKSQIQFEVQTRLPTSLLGGLVAVMNLSDMTKTWVPSYVFPIKLGLSESRELMQISPLERTALYAVDLPWPLTRREVVVHTWFNDDLDDGDECMLMFRTIGKDYRYHNCMPPGARNATQLEMLRSTPDDMFAEGLVLMERVTSGEATITVSCCLDTKLKIPGVLLSLAT